MTRYPLVNRHKHLLFWLDQLLAKLLGRLASKPPLGMFSKTLVAALSANPKIS
jgi:hypothetical protein